MFSISGLCVPAQDAVRVHELETVYDHMVWLCLSYCFFCLFCQLTVLTWSRVRLEKLDCRLDRGISMGNRWKGLRMKESIFWGRSHSMGIKIYIYFLIWESESSLSAAWAPRCLQWAGLRLKLLAGTQPRSPLGWQEPSYSGATAASWGLPEHSRASKPGTRKRACTSEPAAQLPGQSSCWEPTTLGLSVF